MSVVDLVGNTFVGDITGINDPLYVAVTPNGNDVYVTSTGSNLVNRISTATDSIVGSPIALSGVPAGIAISQNNAMAYVAIATGLVSEIDLDTQTLTGTTYTVGADPRAIAITPDGTRLLVATIDLGDVAVIDLVGGTVLTSISTGINRGIGITPEGRWAYAPDFAANDVNVIDSTR